MRAHLSRLSPPLSASPLRTPAAARRLVGGGHRRTPAHTPSGAGSALPPEDADASAAEAAEDAMPPRTPRAAPRAGKAEEAGKAKEAPGFFGRHGDVFIYIPNLIGYARVAFALYAFAVAFSNPLHCILFYFAGFVCDELDGRFARKYNQTSTLGAVLDMVTDRLSTTGLLALLVALYPPPWHMAALCLVLLDIFSHWFQMYATLLWGAATHKDVHAASWLVRVYYQHRLFMGFCCVCCEVLYLALYALAFPECRAWGALPLPAALAAALPAWVVAAVPRAGVPAAALLAAAAAPGCAVKQLCNWVQLAGAARRLVEWDAKGRARAA